MSAPVERTAILVRVPITVRQNLEALAQQNRRSMSCEAQVAIERYVAQQEEHA